MFDKWNYSLGVALSVLGAGAFVIALIGTFLMRQLATRWGLMDNPHGRKQHRAPTPLGGGIAIFVAVWLPVLAGTLSAFLLGKYGRGHILPGWICDYLSGVATRLPRLSLIFSGATILAGMGLVDDLYNLSAKAKLAVQALVAVGLVLGGERISIFIENPWICAAITVVWIVGITNAFNFLDNMDGLSAGVAFIVSTMLLVVALQSGQFFVASFLCVLMGALAGFLVFNFPPATIFMGDCGSQQIGYLLGVLTVDFTFYQPAHPLFPVVVPLLIFAVPIFDTITVVAIRLRQGRSPFVGDRNHFSHRLVRLGLSERQAVFTIYLVSIAVGMGATQLYHTTTGGAIVALIQALVTFAIILVLERPGPTS